MLCNRGCTEMACERVWEVSWHPVPSAELLWLCGSAVDLLTSLNMYTSYNQPCQADTASIKNPTVHEAAHKLTVSAQPSASPTSSWQSLGSWWCRCCRRSPRRSSSSFPSGSWAHQASPSSSSDPSYLHGNHKTELWWKWRGKGKTGCILYFSIKLAEWWNWLRNEQETVLFS